MKAVGIVAEYNPFTNGHLYHMNTIKEKYPDYAIVVVMNGHFTQRGDVSIIDKWKRCEIALKCGADIVVELPFPFATQSADFFADGAIGILEKLKVEKVIFGSECNQIEDLKTIAEIQIDNDDLEKLTKVYSKLGENYPTALSKSIYDLTGKKIETPNDLLGISYIKTILKNHYHIYPEIIQRTNQYHSLKDGSASSVREKIKKNEPITEFVPEIEIPYLTDFHFLDDYFSLLKYKVITNHDLSIYQSVEEGIEFALKREIIHSNSFDELIHAIKSKRYTYNKIKRMLIHILCDFTKEKANNMKAISYIRLLGLSTKGKKYLNQIKKEMDVPIISKVTREKDPMLEYEIELTKIYDIPSSHKTLDQEFDKIIDVGGKND